MKDWKKCMCLMGISLFMASNLCASQIGNVEGSNTPVKKTRSTTFISGESAWEPAGTGVTRQIMGYDGQVMLVKVKFEKGAIGTPHTHYHTQTTYVASGKFEFTVGNEKKVVKARKRFSGKSSSPEACGIFPESLAFPEASAVKPM